MSNQKLHDNTPATPNIRKARGISPLWLLPLVALILACWLVFNALNGVGDRVQIEFSNAQGLIEGRTTIRYQGLEVGIVKNITLAKDLKSIFVDADIYPEASQLLKSSTSFWLVKPQASFSGISGLDALVSGNYIAIQPGTGVKRTEFTALDSPPSERPSTSGLAVILNSDDLSSVSVGTQIFYKKIPIGEVYKFQLDNESDLVKIHALISDKYAHLITTKSRFWNVSGMAANLGFNGLDIQFEGIPALLSGGIAVDSPDDGKLVENKQEFKLYSDIKTAGRGISIKIALPDQSEISPNGSPIMYRGLEIGQINNLHLSEDRTEIIAEATIQPSFSDFLNTGARFVLEEAKVSLSGIENVGNLVRGNYLTIVPSEGEKTRRFTAIRKHELVKEKPDSIQFSLTADSSYGLSADTEVLYKGIAVGAITEVKLLNEKVIFDIIIHAEYKNLIKSRNRFYVTGNATAEFTDDGVSVSIPPASQLLSGSISFSSRGSLKPLKQYTLFKSSALAELADFNASGSTTINLIAKEMPPVSKGSPILYRNLQVGKVASYTLDKEGMVVKAVIENRYAHLITKDSVFWNHSGVSIEAGLDGVSIQAAPLLNLVKGGISFDKVEGVENRVGSKWKLYSSLKDAQQFGALISLRTSDSIAVSKGTKIKYKGVVIGEVTKLNPNFSTGIIEYQSRIYPAFANDIVKANSHFWVVEPTISLMETKDLDALLVNYIRVEPGNGDRVTSFELNQEPVAANSTTFTLESVKRDSVNVGTPILYRDIQVGRVTNIELGSLSDRVLIDISIEDKFAYLIRENTLFWNASGLDVAIGLTGATIHTGTVDSLVRGGIAFSTPQEVTLQSMAKAGKNFLLHPKAQPEWKTWQTAIPNPLRN
jgi:paraquat-inducible protein B